MADQNDFAGLNDDRKKVPDRVLDGIFSAMKAFNELVEPAEEARSAMQILREILGEIKKNEAEEAQKEPE